MEDTIRISLDERIDDLLKKLEEIDNSSEEYATIASNLDKLYKLRLEERKLDNERDTMLEDVSVREHQVNNDRKRNKSEIVRPILQGCFAVMGIGMIILAEREGTIVSKGLGLASSLFKFKG
ncbi:MAG: hypothetical protein J6Y02_08890 [Pseudobutyrivibrio sp.]|nr:hypothetical protein [Pseudobutyrivibrio sp.]